VFPEKYELNPQRELSIKHVTKEHNQIVVLRQIKLRIVSSQNKETIYGGGSGVAR
jgi:ABC-type transporter Mla maintaining outer membrane lipid asymmetry ATPase subunit MlaF